MIAPAEPTPGGPLVALRDVSFWYPGAAEGQPALAGLSLELRQGDFALLCGPSGGGKSTLLKLLLGLVPQLSAGRLAGETSVLGLDPTRVPPRLMAAAGVALVFQNPAESLVATRVDDEIAFGLENLGVDPAEMDARIEESLAAVGLPGYATRHTRALSDGQQQRVAIAAAMALRPRLLLLDEPTAHLDVDTARAVLDLVAHLHATLGTTVLISEHRLGLLAPAASRALVLADGALARDGEPRRVLADPDLPGLGVSVPRATQVARDLSLPPPLPLTPSELAERIVTSSPPAATVTAASAMVDRLPAEEEPGEPALRFEGVSFTYPGGHQALNGVSFELRAGEAAALVGPNGAGKSTLARLSLGLLEPTVGLVWLAGLATHRTPLSQLAARGGLVLQNPLYQLLADRTDAEIALGLRDLAAEEARRRTEQMLEAFDLTGLRHRHPLALSEGQRRRVALAATLARRPRVLLLDEPTLGQDERQRASLVDLTRSLVQAGTALLVITHDPEVAATIGRQVHVRDGRVVGDAVVATVAGSRS